jgi:hypothetical protein
MTSRTPSITLVLSMLLIAGCGPSATTSREQRFDIVFHATTDDDEPLDGVTLRAGDRLLGSSDPTGELRVSLTAVEGQRLTIGVACPASFAIPDPVPPLRLVHSRGVAEQAAGSSSIAFPVVCTRESREVVVIVHSEHGNLLPVLIDGKPVGATDENGVAHLLLDSSRDVPSFEVRLDTTERLDLKPANPTRTFELSGRDVIVLFEQTLTVAPKFAVRKAPPARHIPYRID